MLVNTIISLPGYWIDFSCNGRHWQGFYGNADNIHSLNVYPSIIWRNTGRTGVRYSLFQTLGSASGDLLLPTLCPAEAIILMPESVNNDLLTSFACLLGSMFSPWGSQTKPTFGQGPTGLFAMMETSKPTLSNMVATSHKWPLDT